MNRTIPTDAARPRSNTPGLPRRTLVSAAAWSAPAIALTTASPAAAVSTKLGIITFLTAPAQLDGGKTYTLVGMLTPAEGGALPSEVALTYSGAVTGQSTAAVSGSIFTFEINTSDPEAAAASTVTATAPGYASAKHEFMVVPAPPALGTITMTSTPDAIPQGEERVATGILVAPSGASLPAHVTVVSASPGVASVPATAAVAADGTFSFPVMAVADSGASTISISATGYDLTRFTASVSSKPVPEVPGEAFFRPQYVMSLVGGTAVDWHPMMQTGVRTTDASGVVTDTFTSVVALLNVANRVLALTFWLTELRGRNLPYNIRVTATGGDRLQWLNTRATVTSWSASYTTGSDGTNMQGNQPVPLILRATTTSVARPGGTLTVEYTYPTIPGYRVVANIPY